MEVLGLSLAMVGSGCTARVNPEQAKALAEIEKLAGKVIVDEKGPDKAVILVDLNGTTVTDAGLEHLKRLIQLQRLSLAFTKVTDAGLKHLNGLTQLQRLDLAFTKVSNAGLGHLEGLTELQSLNLSGTSVTDAGVGHLTGLTNLGTLDLGNTEVTDKGVEKLRQALPNCLLMY
jgi:Leucine-rich repeat (LRR) protein